MTPEKAENADRMLFDLAGYLLSSARASLDAPPEQATFRLAEAVSRLCETLVLRGSGYSAAAAGLKRLVDEAKFDVFSDPARLRAVLSSALDLFDQRYRGGP